MPLPLAGFRVIDCSTQLAGPVSATMLADFGADVIKVELPGHAATGITEVVRLHEERNKRSLTLDLHYPEAQELLLKLVETADALVENFRPGTMERWHLGPDRLLARNPRLIYHRLSAYGQTGPWREKGGFDRQAQAFAGTTYVTGDADRPPVRSGFALADYMGALCGAFGIIMAAYWRDARGGTGQVSDLALYEPIFRASEASIAVYSLTGRVRERAGNVNPGIVPSTNYLSRDGVWVAINANTDVLFQRLARAIGRPDLADDPLYRLPHRVAKADELYALIGAWAADHTADEIQTTMDAARVACAPVLSIADIAAHPHFRERESFVPVDCGDLGPVLMANVFPRLSASPGAIRNPAPRRGEHTDAILTELGLDAATIADLRTRHII